MTVNEIISSLLLIGFEYKSKNAYKFKAEQNLLLQNDHFGLSVGIYVTIYNKHDNSLPFVIHLNDDTIKNIFKYIEKYEP